MTFFIWFQVAILQSIFAFDMTGVIGMSARFFSPSIRDTLVSMSEAKSIAHGFMSSATATAGNCFYCLCYKGGVEKSWLYVGY